MRTIEAAVTEHQGAPFAITEVELGGLRPNEVLVEVAAVGICHTDLIMRDQWYPVPLPAVLGHEGAGTVREVGAAVSAVSPGDRVSMSFDSCGHCAKCQSGRPNFCHQFYAHNFGAARPDGSTALSRGGEPVHSHFFGQSSFATWAVATERNVVVLPPDIPFELAAPLGCGLQTGSGAILNTLRPPPGGTVAVFGSGTVGLAAVMAARIAGAARIVAIDTRASRLELARELGAHEVIDASTTDVGEALAGLGGVGVDVAVETTGVPEVLRTAVESTGPGGVTGVIGAPPMGTDVALDVNSILTAGRVIRGIVEGDGVPQVFIPQLIEYWRQGDFPIERLVEGYAFDQIDTAAGDAERGAVIKAVVRM